jgi:hypothetical protein
VKRACVASGFVFAVLSCAAARAQVVTVTTLQDVRDFGGAQRIADLPGPDGRVSFGEAVAAVNNEAGPQTIQFAIPRSEYWLIPTIALLRLEIGPFVLVDDGTTIDFRTQTAFAGDTNPNGWEVGIYGLQANGIGSPAIFVMGNHCTLIGLDDVLQRGYGVEVQGNDNRILSFTTDGPLYSAIHVTGVFGVSTTFRNVIGGTAPGEGNVVSAGGSGIEITGPAEDNVVIGNTCLGSPTSGITVRAASRYGAYARRTRIGGSGLGEGNWVAGNGGYYEGLPGGAQIDVEDADDTLIEGNFLGTTRDGLFVYPNAAGTAGVYVLDSRATTVRKNLCSGFVQIGTNHYAGQRFGAGIDVEGVCADTVVFGNQVGTDVTGTAPIPNVHGIVVTETTARNTPVRTTVGGLLPEQSNLVAFNEREGVQVGALTNATAIRGNRITSNGGLGIDLFQFGTGGGGLTANDALDADLLGANHLQNFPVLLGAAASSTGTRLVGGLESTPQTAFALDFYASPGCDPSGFGEGAEYLGSENVTTGGQGRAAFDVTFGRSLPLGWVVTATATHATLGETSEFSPCAAITEAGTIRVDLPTRRRR